jgi:protein-disulfide isomerase
LDAACHPGLKRPFHERACLFARAAVCAGEEGRFWEMNDALFSSQDTKKSAEVDPVDLAVRLGLDRSSFKKCLDSNTSAEIVAGDIRDAMKKNLEGTPSFLIDGQLFLGRIPKEELEKRLGRVSQKV